jgi:heme/copper-type cytochrome/quinol oxidase subunit 2
MDLISILTTVILATTISTVLIGVAAYAAFKLRDKRKPKAKKDGADGKAGAAALEAVFLTKYVPVNAMSSALEAEPVSNGS